MSAPAGPERQPRARSEPDPSAEDAPHVDEVLAADLERPIRCMGSAEDQDLAVREHLLEGQDALVLHVWIRAQDASPGPLEQLPELERERRPRVVGLGLERHAKDPDRPALER